MHLEDVLKFFNRIGVRVVNDVTAQIAAEVTAAMDPEGMGVHMGAEAPSAHIEVATKADLAAQESNFVTQADFGKAVIGWTSALVDASTIVTENVLNVMSKHTDLVTENVLNVMSKHTDLLVARMDDKMRQEEERVDKNMADLEQKIKARHNKQRRIMDAKDRERDAKDKERDELIASLQRDRSNKQKNGWSNVATNIYKKNGSNVFMWKKTIKRIPRWESGFQTMEEVVEALAVRLQNEGTSAESE